MASAVTYPVSSVLTGVLGEIFFTGAGKPQPGQSSRGPPTMVEPGATTPWSGTPKYKGCGSQGYSWNSNQKVMYGDDCVSMPGLSSIE